MAGRKIEFVKCERTYCCHNKRLDGMPGLYCETLAQLIEGKECPFFKTEKQEIGEAYYLGIGDFEGFRKYSGTHRPTLNEVKAWLKEFEDKYPTDDPEIRETLEALLESPMIPVYEAEKKIAKWMRDHHTGNWCSSPEETARYIMEGDDDDKIESDEALSDERLSE
ncbi:MAG: hypothetical protein IJI87_07535 [Mogibacterium sp.]|nr:hypothetical protein [Mogibacterium sp.]